MKPKINLRYEDLVSPTLSPDSYLKLYKEKIINTYSMYEPKSDVLGKIKNFLSKKNQRLKIVALGADWCPDCNRNVPRMIKVIKTLNSKDVQFRILYGIMVDALHKPGEDIWHKTRSPPEAINPKFDLKKIPTFYFFNKDHELIGTIQENPKKSLEEDLLDILEFNT